MGTDEPLANRLRVAALVWGDALAYAGTVAAVATLSAVAVGVATGGGLVRAKVILFFAGFVLMAYATVRLWPSSPSDLEPDTMQGVETGESMPKRHDRTRFQAFVQALPPRRWMPSPPPEPRMSLPGKLFVGSVLVLAVSFVMETVFGIV